MDEGFILSNKYRITIMEGLASGETDIYSIAKKHRIIPSVAKKIIDNFIQGELVKKNNNKYILTEKGKKIAENIKG